MFKLALVHQLWDVIKLVLTQVSQENGDRKPSLRELPSYRKEANQALNRREDLKSLSQVCDGFFEFDTKKILSQLEFFMSEGKILWPNSLGWNF